MKQPRFLVPLMLIASMAAPLLAQEGELRLPRIDEAPAAPVFRTFILLFLLIGLLVFAATLKPKRTHQD